MAKKEKVYQINGSDDFLKISNKKKLSIQDLKMKGFLDDNEGKFLLEDQARDAWLLACIKYGKTFSGNVPGTRGKGFDMNVPWVAKRCNSVKVFVN